MLKLFIDAGHNASGWNTGASANGMKEQDITWEVANLVAKFLDQDFDVKLSRPTKETNLGNDNSSSINARWQMANEWNADYFISIHTNMGGGTGAEAFFFDNGDERANKSQGFSEKILDIFCNTMTLRNRGVKPDTQTHVGSIGVLRQTTMPAMLIELAFKDSPSSNPDVFILQNRRFDMARALAEGINDYFGISKKPFRFENELQHLVMDTFATVQYQGITYQILATLHNDRYIVPLGELAKIFGDIKVPLRAVLEAAGLKVTWDPETGIVTVK